VNRNSALEARKLISVVSEAPVTGSLGMKATGIIMSVPTTNKKDV
jgi:hypothetical protein